MQRWTKIEAHCTACFLIRLRYHTSRFTLWRCGKVRRSPDGPISDGTSWSSHRMYVTSSPGAVSSLHLHVRTTVRQLPGVFLCRRQTTVLRQRRRSAVPAGHLTRIRLPHARSLRHQAPAVWRKMDSVWEASTQAQPADKTVPVDF